ncbi:MAG TPA: serine/threonine-protein kinase [Casimicrobiaceae bacterium]|nr:serine/threonine-protein kinase [Casimicrobiaceae bacterium]
MAEVSNIGKYEIRREIGRGAMGVVYEGYDPAIKRVVALKTIRSDQLASDQPEAVIARFRREAVASGRLNHPNIVAIYDLGEDNGTWFIAMEYVQGRELKECFQDNERFKTTDIVRIMSQILSALDYSHRQGVIHRDVKPANIFLLPDGSVKVADFGIAHIESSNLTQAGTVMGTPAYMSPEQIMGLPVDGRSDLFSAGVILYQFLTGERPFAGSTATTTMQKVLKEEPLAPSTLNVQLSPAMDAVVRKALAKNADERFQTAREFAEAIRAAAPGAAVPVAAATPVGNADPTLITGPATAASGAPTPADREPASPRAAAAATAPVKPSRTPVVATLVVAGVIALGAGAWFLSQRQSADTGSSTHASGPSSAQPKVASPSTAPEPARAASTSQAEPGMLLVSAVGLIDPTDSRYQSDKKLLQSDLRADSKEQLVEKTLGLLLDTNSLNKNYDLFRERLLPKSNDFIRTVVRESEPHMGKDGLMSMTTEAVVNVKAVQKSLNQMSREERIEFIRASGDPKVSVRISVRDADQPDAPPQPSPVAENILKERIKSFGFRTWAEGGSDADKGADFAVIGEAKLKKLSARLPASGLVVTKYTLTSWTVKCIDRETGEEIYYSTTLPKGVGSWASEEEALNAIGAKIADEFSRDFFLQHANVASQRVTLYIDGMPDAHSEELLAGELVGLARVIVVTPGPPAKPRAFELQLAGPGAPGELVADGVLKPLNAKLGQTCFALGSVSTNRVSVVFDKRCADASVLNRLETNPPASLYGAPPGRQKMVIKNPELLRKLTI